jgi:zinc and cadmium transporter
MTLVYISAASLIGGLLSISLAALVSFATRAHWVSSLISFAIGALLGAAFLEVLPHAFGNSTNIQGTAATVLGGILAFFVLEKLVLWRHCHVEDCEVHGSHEDEHGHAHEHARAQPQHDHGRSGLMIVVGDSFHNFVDGVLIAAAFMESTALGLVTATAVIAHEIPQEVGDFLIPLHSGYTNARAFVLNLLSSLMMVVGAIGAYFALQVVGEWVNTLLALAAASMIYVAVADLIPGLHKRPELAATAQQVLLILLGIACV